MTTGPSVEKMEAQLKTWEKKFNRLDLKDRAAMVEMQPQIEYHKRINVIRAKRAAAQAKFEEFRTSGDEKGHSLKIGLELALKDLENAFKEMMK